jgi:hypothetical protein
MVVKFRNTIWPPPPQLSLHIGELRGQAIQMEHGPYIAEITQKAVYIVRCLCMSLRVKKLINYIPIDGHGRLQSFFSTVY